jgi:hypothetical protein
VIKGFNLYLVSLAARGFLRDLLIGDCGDEWIEVTTRDI